MNVMPTVETIKDIARLLERGAQDLRHIADTMEQDGDITGTAEALNVVRNTVGNLRLDLLFVRPWREHERSQKDKQ